MEIPYPHWNETTQSSHTMVASSVQSNSVNRSENTTPTIDQTYCNSGYDDTKPDLTRLLSDTSQAEENIDSNNDNNEWIDVGHLQNFQPGDVTRLQKNEVNKNAEKTVHNLSNSPSHINHENILEAILLTNCGRTDTDKGINDTEAVLKQDEKELTVINIDDSEDEIIEDDAEVQNSLNINRKEKFSKEKSNKDSQFSENSKETIPATEERILYTTLQTKKIKADTIKKRSTNEEQPLQEKKQTRNVPVCTENTETTTPKERSVLRAILLRPVLKVEQYKIQNEENCLINRNSNILLNNLDAKRPRLHRKIVEVLSSAQTPSKYYRCNVCRYTTTSAFYFQIHLKSELHIIAVQQYKMGVINHPGTKFKTYSRKVRKKPDEERSWTKKISKLNLSAQQYELYLDGKQNQTPLSTGKEEQEQAATIVIEDSDKEDEDVVEEKIEIEENVLEPGVEYETSNTSAMNNEIFKQQIFSRQLFKCMVCKYSTGLVNHFQNHLHSVRHKWALQEQESGNSKSTNSLENTTRNVPKVISQHVVESNSKVLEMNPNGKRKVPREVITKKKQKQFTPAKRKPTTTITIEDSDKDDDVEEKIEVKENVLQHKVNAQAKNSGHLTQPTSPNWYWCSKCRYTTTIKSCFQDHFLSAVHKDADLEKQNTTNTIDIEDNVKDDTTSSAQTKSALQWYWCNVCHYTTTRQRHFKSHFDSTRHQYSVNNKNGCIANKTRKPQIMQGKKTSQSTISKATDSKGKWSDRFVIKPHTEKKKGETSSDKQSQTQTIIVEDSDNEDDNALFKCDLCNCATRKKHTFQTHLQSETHQRAVSKKQNGIDNCTLVEVQTQRWYRCEICHYKTRRKKSIDSHFQSKYHIDSVLAAATNSSKHLPNEIEDIQVAKETNFAPPKEYNCSCCTYATQSITDLKVHTVAKHTLRGRSQWYCCDMCNFKTRDRYSFKAHLECQKHQDTMCAVQGGEEDDLIVDEVIEDMEENEEKEEDDEEVAKINQPANSIHWTETEVIVKEEESECTQINYTTESEFLEFHELRQEYGKSAEAKTRRIGTLDCEDWAEINVEEDTNECEDYILCED